MTRLTLTLTVIVLCLSIGCKKEKYSDVKVIINKMTMTYEQYIQSVDKAHSADDIVRAIDNLAESIAGLNLKMKSMREKYPELTKPETVPEELRDALKLKKKTMLRMAGSQFKIIQFLKDNAVQRAFLRLGRAIESSQ